MAKRQLTAWQEANFYPFIDEQRRKGFIVPSVELARLLMFHFDTGPNMAAQAQREFIKSKGRAHAKSDREKLSGASAFHSRLHVTGAPDDERGAHGVVR